MLQVLSKEHYFIKFNNDNTIDENIEKLKLLKFNKHSLKMHCIFNERFEIYIKT